MRQPITTAAAPQAIGPYSQGISAGGFVFVSGQLPLDPATGQMARGDIRAQTHQALRNLAAVLEAGGASLDHVVRTTIFLADMGDFAAVNEVYGTYFPERPPARATVQVAALPKGARVEIDCIAAS